MNDYVFAALPLIFSVLVALVSLPVLRRSTQDGQWPLWRKVALIALAAAWVGSFGLMLKSVSDARSLKERMTELGRIVERDIGKGKELLDRIENDSEWSAFPQCRDMAVLGRYQKPVEAWRTSTARTLARELPNSGADRRFLHVTERRAPGPCGQVDYVYWRLFDLLENLHSLWESIDRYCVRVGPTCRAEQHEVAERNEHGATRVTGPPELFYSSVAQVAAALLALMGAFFLYRLVNHVGEIGELRAAVDEKVAEYARTPGDPEDRRLLRDYIEDFRRKAIPRWTGLAFATLFFLAVGCVVWPLLLLGPPGHSGALMVVVLAASLSVFFAFCGWQFSLLRDLRQIELPSRPSGGAVVEPQ